MNGPGLKEKLVPGIVILPRVSRILQIWQRALPHGVFPEGVWEVGSLLWVRMRLRLGGCLKALRGVVVKSESVAGLEAKALQHV